MQRIRGRALAGFARTSLAIQIVSLAALGAVLAGGGVGLIVVDSARTALREDVLRASLANAQLAGELTANYLNETQNPAQGLAEWPSFRGVIANGGMEDLTSDLESWLRRNGHAENASIYDLTGLNRATGLADKSVVGRISIADRPYFQTALTTGQPQQGEAVISRTTSRPSVPYSIPFRDRAGNVVGVLQVGVSLAALSNALAEAHLGANARTSLVDLRRGVYLIPPDPSLVLEAVPQDDPLVQHLMAGASGTLETTDTTGTEMLAAFAPVPNQPWVVIVEQPSADAFAPVQATMQRSIRAIVLLVLLLALLGAGLAAHITRPLSELRRAAEAMARGELARRVGLDRRDELGELGRAFDGMAKQLQINVTELEESLGRTRAVMDSVAEGILTIDAGGRVASSNPAAQMMLGYSALELIGQPAANLLSPEFRPLLSNAMQSTAAGACKSRTGAAKEVTGLRKDGSTFPLELGLTDTHVDSERHLIAVLRDITDRKQFQEELTRLAFRDPLTGLPNRALFLDRLKQALSRTDRQGTSVGVLFLDLDNFKVANDSLGHQRGDTLLVEAAQRLQSCLRAEDTPARLGGDEFAVILEGVVDENAATEVADRIATALQTPVQIEGREVFVTASIGVALSMSSQDRPDTLIRRADMAMYSAKSNGKARYAIFDARLEAGMLDRLDLQTDMRRALEHGEFRVHYQPIVSLDNGSVVGLEALVRWQHPERGLIPPADFIPHAEETGLIVPLGQFVLEEACREARRWQDRFPTEPPIGISINVSARQFQHPTLVQDIDRAWRQANLDPSTIRLEITETVLMRDPDAAQMKLLALRERGIQIAVDDFGTGYSSLTYLKRFPIDTLKIDRSFVQGLGHDPHDTAIVRSVIDLAKSLGLIVTAEGIESPSQRAHLQLLGCERGQGYLFARPQPAEEISPLISSTRLETDQHVAA